MTGDHNEGTTAPRRRTEWPDELEMVGPGPIVVHNQSRKMSIYGPKFTCGPPQLRKQRLYTKMRDEAEASIAQKTAQLVSEDEKARKRKDEKLKLRKASKWEKSEEENIRKVGVVFNHYQEHQLQQLQGQQLQQNQISQEQLPQSLQMQQFAQQQYEQPCQINLPHSYYNQYHHQQYQGPSYQEQQYQGYGYNQFQDYNHYQQQFHQYPLVNQYPDQPVQYSNQF